MQHVVSTKVVTRDQRQYRKVTCSCGHFIIITDSQTTATAMAQYHVGQPECSRCHHRNTHHPRTGCTYVTEQSDAGGYHTCLCRAEATPTPTPLLPIKGDDCTDIALCPVCAHPEHGERECMAEIEGACNAYCHCGGTYVL